MRRKILILTFVMLLLNVQYVLANVYGIGDATKAKKMTDYNSTTTVDQMDTVLFGSYPQSDITGIVKEPIEWLVVAARDEGLYLLSKKILDVQQKGITAYTKSYKDFKLRDWLNHDFLSSAFNSVEQNLIVPIEWNIHTIIKKGYPYYTIDWENAKMVGTCNDKVSIPSLTNLDYITGQGDIYDSRIDSEPTPFALANINKIKDPNGDHPQIGYESSTSKERYAHMYWTRTHSNDHLLWFYEYMGNSKQCLHQYTDTVEGYKGVRPYIVVSLKGEN